MTNDELESGLIRVANAVERLAESTQLSIEALTRKDDRLTDGQLALQQQIGILSEIVLEVRAETRSLNATVERLDQAIQEMRAENQELKQRQAESDQRFEVLLAEVQYLIRCLPPQSES